MIIKKTKNAPLLPLGKQVFRVAVNEFVEFFITCYRPYFGYWCSTSLHLKPPPNPLNNFLLVIARHMFVHLQTSPDTYDLTVMSKEAQALELGAKDVVW